MSTSRLNARTRISDWLQRWGPLLPVLVAEFIVMLGFGALLPVLALFVRDQGIDPTALGIIIAGWPIARLIFEPIGGWWADRHDRKPQMVIGLAVIGLSSVAMLFATTVVALFLLRFAAGAASGFYGAAARGMIVDATDEDERGEAFGFYASFQMGGFVIGPALGAFGTALIGGYAFPFVLTGTLGLVASGALAVFLKRQPHLVEDERFPHHPEVAPPITEVPFSATSPPIVVPSDSGVAQAPLRAVFNRMVMAAIVIGFGMQLSFGVYEVVWSIYMIDLGASIEWIGVTFILFALPSMIAAPIAGRLMDRQGPMRYIVAGGLMIMVGGSLYALASEPIMPSIVVPIEATATAILGTALFTLVARGSPAGRASTAQGIYGASGTVALIFASIFAGALFERQSSWPFWFFVGGLAVCLAIGLLIYYGRWPRRSARPLPEGAR